MAPPNPNQGVTNQDPSSKAIGIAIAGLNYPLKRGLPFTQVLDWQGFG
jgi:hypothetical protein